MLEPQIAAILEAMCQQVAERRHELDLILMPGVKETLSHLAERGALLGVATGNLEMIGWIKIEEAGLREWFRFGGFSDHFPVRSELIGHAASKARELAGAEASVCVVGDTPRDIEAARANVLSVIAVATGHFSFDELLEHRPEVCATSLADLLAATRGNGMKATPMRRSRDGRASCVMRRCRSRMRRSNRRRQLLRTRPGKHRSRPQPANENSGRRERISHGQATAGARQSSICRPAKLFEKAAI